MQDTLVESQGRTVRGNRILISLRLLLATVSLALLLIQEYAELHRREKRTGSVAGSGMVTALSFSQDGKLLYSSGLDGFFKIWDVEKGRELNEGIQCGGVVTAIRPDPMGKLIALNMADQRVRVLELSPTFEANFRLALEMESPTRVMVWSPDGTRLMTGGGENNLKIWDVSSGKVIANGGADSRNAVAAGFLPNQTLSSIDLNGHEKKWDAATLKNISDIQVHQTTVLVGEYSVDGRLLASAGDVLRLRDLKQDRELQAVEAHTGGVNGLAFSRDGTLLLSTGMDKRIKIWKVGQSSIYRLFSAQPYLIQAEALSPDGQWVATGCDPYIKVWDVENSKMAWELEGHRLSMDHSQYIRGGPAIGPVQEIPLYFRPEGMIVIIVLLLTLIYSYALKKVELAAKLAPLQIIVDVALVSVLVYHTGDVESPFASLYLISIVSAAFVLSWKAAVMIAAMSSTFFSLVTLLYGLGQIPATYASKVSPGSLQKFLNLSVLDYVYFLLLPICAFFLVAYLAGTLSRRLAATRHLHQEVLEGLGEGIMLMDPAGRIIYQNKEFIRMLGLPFSATDLTLPSLLGDSVSTEANLVMTGGSGRRLEVSHTRPDGSIIPLAVRMIPVQDPDSSERGLILVLDDITAEKKMEEFYKHKERIETMGQISATIAHEIRNPLASIRGAVQEIARSVNISEDKKILIEIVLSESDRLDQIITDFLRYARTRSPQLKLVDICELISGLRLLLASRPEAKDTDLQINASEDIPPFNADAEQLRQVFLNLGLNALQALDGCPERRISFSIAQVSLHKAQGLNKELAENRVDRNGVMVEIRDTGRGIPQDVQQQMFEPFFTTKANGTGLGLAIVDRIIQGHEGLITVESGIGEGTAFKIWLPVDNTPERTAVRLRSAATLPVVK